MSETYTKIAKGTIYLDDMQERVNWDKYSDGVVEFWSPRCADDLVTKIAIDMAKAEYYKDKAND